MSIADKHFAFIKAEELGGSGGVEWFYEPHETPEWINVLYAGPFSTEEDARVAAEKDSAELEANPDAWWSRYDSVIAGASAA